MSEMHGSRSVTVNWNFVTSKHACCWGRLVNGELSSCFKSEVGGFRGILTYKTDVRITSIGLHQDEHGDILNWNRRKMLSDECGQHENACFRVGMGMLS